MKILIVDDHVLIRDALRGVLRDLKPEALIFEAIDSRQALHLATDHPDLQLALLDLNLPDRDGFAVLKELRERYPALSIVVLSGFHERVNVMRALDLGASGFIPKSAPREVMFGALNLVFSGGVYIPPEILEAHAAAPDQASPTSGTWTGAQPSPASLGLTERQIDVLALLMQGKSNKAICRKLDLAEPTVKNHVTAILKALKVSNRTEAVLAATSLGWALPRADQR